MLRKVGSQDHAFEAAGSSCQRDKQGEPLHRHGLTAANLKMTNVPEREGKRSQNMSQNWTQPKKGRWPLAFLED